jgi:hypothetical protein
VQHAPAPVLAAPAPVLAAPAPAPSPVAAAPVAPVGHSTPATEASLLLSLVQALQPQTVATPSVPAAGSCTSVEGIAAIEKVKQEIQSLLAQLPFMTKEQKGPIAELLKDLFSALNEGAIVSAPLMAQLAAAIAAQDVTTANTLLTDLRRAVQANEFLHEAALLIQDTYAGRLVLSTVRRHASVLKLHVFPFLIKLKQTEPTLMPVPEHVLLLLLAYRFHQSGTLYAASSAFDAVRWFQHAGLHRPYQDESVFHSFLQTLHKRHGRRVQHTPLPDMEWVKTLLHYCSRKTASLVEKRLGCVVAIMVATCSRKADVLRLRLGSVEILPDRINFMFWVTKTDQFRSGYQKSLCLKDDSLRVGPIIRAYMKSMGAWRLPPDDIRNGHPLFGPIKHVHQGEPYYMPMTMASPPVSTSTISKSFTTIRPKKFWMHGVTQS